jgi:hypothetical protein
VSISQDKKIELIIHIFTCISFIFLILFSVTWFNYIIFIPFICYCLIKSRENRTIVAEAIVYQLLTWFIVMMWNTFIIKFIWEFKKHMGIADEKFVPTILLLSPIYIILFILFIFGPLTGIIYVLQGKNFHYPVISRWITIKKKN